MPQVSNPPETHGGNEDGVLRAEATKARTEVSAMARERGVRRRDGVTMTRTLKGGVKEIKGIGYKKAKRGVLQQPLQKL